MPILSKFKTCLYRHRNKFYLGGILITGSILALKYAQKCLKDWHEKEAMEFIERNRKQNHFDSINRTCNQTVLNLSASLLENVYHTIDTDEIINDLKRKTGNKLEMWNTLKNLVFVKAGIIVYSLIMLVITLKLQLNIVGSYLYKDPTSVPSDMQEKYLSLCQDFLSKGVGRLANILQIKVDNILNNVNLKKDMKLSDVEAIFWSIQGSLDSDTDGPINQFKSYVFEANIPTTDDTYCNMLKDTADLLECEEVKFLAIHLINRGFTLLADQLSEFFEQKQSKITELSENSNEFNNPFNYKKPLAKLIPILNGLLSKQSLPQNLLQDLIVNDKLQTLCANVYESLLV